MRCRVAVNTDTQKEQPKNPNGILVMANKIKFANKHINITVAVYRSFNEFYFGVRGCDRPSVTSYRHLLEVVKGRKYKNFLHRALAARHRANEFPYIYEELVSNLHERAGILTSAQIERNAERERYAIEQAEEKARMLPKLPANFELVSGRYTFKGSKSGDSYLIIENAPYTMRVLEVPCKPLPMSDETTALLNKLMAYLCGFTWEATNKVSEDWIAENWQKVNEVFNYLVSWNAKKIVFSMS